MPEVVPTIDTWSRLQAAVHEAKIKAAFKAFRQAGIEPVLFKGWAAARNYPAAMVRQIGDIDLAVSPAQIGSASDLIKTDEVGHLFIDLKAGLSSLDTVDWDILFERSELVELQDSQIRILCPEDHLRVICNHWLIDGGRFKDKLWDIYYAVENRPADFHWERCLGNIPDYRKDWVIIAIGIARHYLDLRVDDLPFMVNSKPIPQWILKTVEDEWKKAKELMPILSTTTDKRQFMTQMFRRFPPNPIRATIEGNGDLYGHMRSWYQVMVLVRRSGPFLKGLFRLMTGKLSKIWR
jgi:hypothetical protein